MVPSGAVNALMLPPKRQASPLNQEPISSPLMEAFVSDRRSAETTAPFTIKCDIPFPAARSSLLKRWKALHHATMSPKRITELARAALVLTYLEYGRTS